MPLVCISHLRLAASARQMRHQGVLCPRRSLPPGPYVHLRVSASAAVAPSRGLVSAALVTTWTVCSFASVGERGSSGIKGYSVHGARHHQGGRLALHVCLSAEHRHHQGLGA